jgi:hypothetical protein
MATREGLADAGGAKFQICLASFTQQQLYAAWNLLELYFRQSSKRLCDIGDVRRLRKEGHCNRNFKSCSECFQLRIGRARLAAFPLIDFPETSGVID